MEIGSKMRVGLLIELLNARCRCHAEAIEIMRHIFILD